jgi:uncharacterized protein
MIERLAILSIIKAAIQRSRVVVLSGPRQCGKTTLARELLSEESVNYFDLGDPASLARLDEPMTALRPLNGLVVIDEVQRRPDLFPVLRVLSDRKGAPSRYLILGSASGDLLRQSSESLAGRMEYVTMGGFTLSELGAPTEPTLWRRGGFPLSYLAKTEADSLTWRKNFVRTLLERDFPQWGVRVPAAALQRFWTMLAHYHGQVWNAAEPARALGVSESTTRRYLDLLTDALMIRQLQPWHANLGKRQVKAPKTYVRDTGLLHHLLGIDTAKALVNHPKLGASWEGFVIEQNVDDGTARRRLFLGNPPRSGDRFDIAPWRPVTGGGMQTDRCSAPHAFDPHRPGRPGNRTNRGHLSRQQTFLVI